MPNTLTEPNYQKLILDISQIYESARQKAILAANDIFTLARWEMGRRLVEEEQRGNLRADYGDTTIKRASRDLTQKFGRGFSVSNLQYFRQFYLSYPIHHTCGELSWSHYRFLSIIKDKGKRTFYEKSIIKNNWSARDLLKQIRKDKIELIKIAQGQRKIVKRQSKEAPKLSLTRGLLYTYKLIQVKGKEGLLVDCGFNFHEGVPIKYSSNPKEADIVESVQTETGFYVKTSERTKNDLYTYQALVQEIVDGDTLWAEIDVGFSDSTRQKLRLRGIDCPEIDTAKGKEAAEFVRRRLSACPFIIVKTFDDNSDKYDRYLADIFYSQDETDPQVVAETGNFLNQELLDAGLAKLWEE